MSQRMRNCGGLWAGWIAVLLLGIGGLRAPAQEDGGTKPFDGGGREVLESIYVPPMTNAPFSMTLETEWTRPLGGGGSYTLVNSRAIKRDSAGRIYMERVILTPKGRKMPHEVSAIQITDPVAHTFSNCFPAQHVCQIFGDSAKASPHFELKMHFPPGPMANGEGVRTHEDLGQRSVAGVLVHMYRDTTTLNPGVMGNDLPMSTVREFGVATELGMNLTSIVDSPNFGRQTFTATDLSMTEPDPKWFELPEGYRVEDRRKAAATAPTTTTAP